MVLECPVKMLVTGLRRSHPQRKLLTAQYLSLVWFRPESAKNRRVILTICKFPKMCDQKRAYRGLMGSTE
jgi:hypothetical protein